MNRKQVQSEGSLDLLLDTICNTFGGVVFIALLVVLLLRLSPIKQLSASVQSSSKIRAALQWQEALQSNHELLADLQSQITEAALRWDDSVMTELKELQEMEKKELQIKQELGDSLLTLVETEDKISSVKASLEVLKNKRIRAEKIRTETAAVVSTLENALQTLTVQNNQIESSILPPSTLDRPVELPIEQSDSNNQISLFVKFGRLYFPFDSADNINTSDFLIERGWVYNVAKPKLFEGIPINGNGDPTPEIARRLSRFPPRNYFVHIAICRDSFDYFQGLKAQLSQLGYRYHLTPLGDGDSVVTGSGPTSSQ